MGVEYTCPECHNNYLLPSPYRPIQPSDSSDFIEYKELHKRLLQANHTIAILNDELSKAHEDLDVEQRSRKKSNESLIILSQAFTALQEKYNNLSPTESDQLAVVVAAEEPESQQTSVDVNQEPSEDNAMSSPRTPMPLQNPGANNVVDQLENSRSKLLIHYNTRIKELVAEIPGAQGSQKKSFEQHLRLNFENKMVVEKLDNLRYISSKIAANLSNLQDDAMRNVDKHKQVIAKFTATVLKFKERQESSTVENQDSQGEIKLCLEKISKFEEAASRLNISDLQRLTDRFQENDQLLPNDSQMHNYSTVSKKLKRVKAKHVKLANINRTLKQKKCKQNLEYILTESREYCESRQSLIEANNTISNLRKELSKACEDLNLERKKSTKSSKALTIISCSLTALQENYGDRLSQIVSQASDTAATAIKHEESSSNSTPITEIAQPPSESKTALKFTTDSRQIVDLSVHNDLKTQYTILQRKYIDELDKKSKDQPPRKITAAKTKKQAFMADSTVVHNYKVEIEQLEKKAKSVKGAEKNMITQRIAICHFNKDTIRRVYGLREMTDKTMADIQRSQKEARELAAEKEKTLSEIRANVEQAERLQNTSKISSDDLSKNLVTCIDSISQLEETSNTSKQHFNAE